MMVHNTHIYKYIYIYIYDTSLYLLSQHCVYFDTSHSLSSQHVSARRVIIKWITNIKFFIFQEDFPLNGSVVLSFTMNCYYLFLLVIY
jgi:hypothetical protein